MNDSFDIPARSDLHIEVHKFRSGAVVFATVAALVLESLRPRYFSQADMLELPLLVTIYFGLSRRNPSTGLLLGTTIGLLQDVLNHTALGINGIAKTVVGYIASSIGGRLDTEHPASRFALTIVFYVLHHGIIALVRRLLLAQPEAWFSTKLAIAAGVNGLVAVALFLLLDRLRKSS